MADEVDLEAKWKLALRRCGRSVRTGRTELGRPDTLNQQQTKAANASLEVPLAILAGAGTGKTTTLLGRVRHLLNSGATPDTILLLSFTNKSADDLVERLVGALGASVARSIHCTTIHSFALALLRCFGQHLGFDGDIKVADARAQISILQEAWKWSQLEEERKSCSQWLGLDPLASMSWTTIFEACSRQHERLFEECLVSGQGNHDAAPRAGEHAGTTEFVTTLCSLKEAMSGQQPRLQQASFQYGHILLEPTGRSMHNHRWWAAQKAWRPQKGLLVPKGAILTKAELMRPLSGNLAADAGLQLLTKIRETLVSHPLTQVRVRFEMPLAPPSGSPAALKAKEDPRWRQKLAVRIHRKLHKFHKPESPSRVPEFELELPTDGVKKLRKKITVAKQSKQSASDFMKTNQPGDMAFCYSYYQDCMRQRGLVDFQDMLIMASKVLDSQALRQLVRSQVRHLLVDEFQDVSPIQLDVLTPLIGDGPNRSLCVVGDDDQTIYTWNGSTTRIFDLLRDQCKQLHALQLTDNYRSTRPILEVGHFVLAPNVRRMSKTLRAKAAWADGPDNTPPLLIECGHPEDEAKAIADEIEKLRQNKEKQLLYEPSDMAVLFRCFRFGADRTHQPLVKELTKRCIPYHVVRDDPLWERSFALDLLAYLDLAAGGDDDSSFLRALRTPPRGCGPLFVARLQERQEQAKDKSQRKSFLMLAEELLREKEISRIRLSPKAQKGLQNLLATIDELRLSCATLPVHEALKTVAASSGYGTWLGKQKKRRLRSSSAAGSTRKHSRKTADNTESDEDEQIDGESEDQPEVDEEEAAAEKANNAIAENVKEAVAAASCFAERWESPYGSVRKKVTLPGLFELCSQHLMRSTSLAQVAEHLPQNVLDKVAACCGAGRIQIQDFLRHVALDPQGSSTPTMTKRKTRKPGKDLNTNRGVCVSTIHAAKGLEWPVVFAARWNEEVIPMKPREVEELRQDGTIVRRPRSDAETQEFVEEERRLAHVAATRAQRRLVISYVRSFSAREKTKADVSSIQLPHPILQERSSGAAIWKRVRQKTPEEAHWEGVSQTAGDL